MIQILAFCALLLMMTKYGRKFLLLLLIVRIGFWVSSAESNCARALENEVDKPVARRAYQANSFNMHKFDAKNLAALQTFQEVPQPVKTAYWQAGCGPFTVGRMHQAKKIYTTVGVEMSIPSCSVQEGVDLTSGAVRENVSLSGTAGAFGYMTNRTFVSYDSKGFHHMFDDAPKTGHAWGTPQAGISLQVTIRTK